MYFSIRKEIISATDLCSDLCYDLFIYLLFMLCSNLCYDLSASDSMFRWYWQTGIQAAMQVMYYLIMARMLMCEGIVDSQNPFILYGLILEASLCKKILKWVLIKLFPAITIGP